jgi:hypothetical protein
MMRAYVLATGIVFGLLAVAHLARMIGENRDPAQTPWYVGITLVAAGLSAWAFVVLRRSRA